MGAVKRMSTVLFSGMIALVVLAGGAGPARAAETPQLSRHEAAKIVKELLREYIGPAVTTDPKRQSVRVWACEAHQNKGTCRGAVAAGDVTCRGSFRVVEFPQKYRAYPLDMDCERFSSSR